MYKVELKSDCELTIIISDGPSFNEEIAFYDFIRDLDFNEIECIYLDFRKASQISSMFLGALVKLTFESSINGARIIMFGCNEVIIDKFVLSNIFNSFDNIFFDVNGDIFT